jgi:two-component system, LuxR family, response regulator FixJ
MTDASSATPATAPTVFVVEDDDDVRQALALLLRSVALRAVAFPSPQAFLEHYQADTYPACLLLDLRLPGMSGLDLFEALKLRGSRIPTVIMTGHGEVGVAVRAIKAGVFDFIEKPFKDQVMLDLIHHALAQCAPANDEAAGPGGFAERIDALTSRERQVMRLVVQGRLNRVIAADLGLSIRTVELHRSRVMEKLRARTFSDLVRMVTLAESVSM